MYELLIDKVIGEDSWEPYTGVSEEVSARAVREKLAAFPEGENELRIVIDSPGGDVFEGITIFNIIRDFARSHADVKITTYIQGMAASMASVIALAASLVSSEQNKVLVEDNAVFMIHNAWDAVMGNKNDLRAAADFLAQVDGVLCASYVHKTGKSEKEVAALMDEETWLWGKEIKEAGFADEIIYSKEGQEKENAKKTGEGEGSRNSYVLNAMAKYNDAQKMLEAVRAKNSKAEKRSYGAAAMALGFKGTTFESSLNVGKTVGDSAVQNKTDGRGSLACKKGDCMTVEDLKRDNPEVYAQVIAEGERAGFEKEQSRVSRLIAMGEKSGAKDYALECVKNGANPADAEVVDAFLDRGIAAKMLAAQKEDEKSIPALNNLPANSLDDSEEINNYFQKSMIGG